ncbi:hypothetical protein SLEP1_g34932 [Rubroshorea leprosula]|uniref:Uncharacterized protein n=1 Tax=Rubroshorea leprosula TaxID=152421 RepID=A0AAV5KLK6_9ROSI|nr:hypothetical protein SLEP1_g34932 [Rubroshorea leprosula]
MVVKDNPQVIVVVAMVGGQLDLASHVVLNIKLLFVDSLTLHPGRI